MPRSALAPPSWFLDIMMYVGCCAVHPSVCCLNTGSKWQKCCGLMSTPRLRNVTTQECPQLVELYGEGCTIFRRYHLQEDMGHMGVPLSLQAGSTSCAHPASWLQTQCPQLASCLFLLPCLLWHLGMSPNYTLEEMLCHSCDKGN